MGLEPRVTSVPLLGGGRGEDGGGGGQIAQGQTTLSLSSPTSLLWPYLAGTVPLPMLSLHSWYSRIFPSPSSVTPKHRRHLGWVRSLPRLLVMGRIHHYSFRLLELKSVRIKKKIFFWAQNCQFWIFFNGARLFDNHFCHFFCTTHLKTAWTQTHWNSQRRFSLIKYTFFGGFFSLLKKIFSPIKTIIKILHHKWIHNYTLSCPPRVNTFLIILKSCCNIKIISNLQVGLLVLQY